MANRKKTGKKQPASKQSTAKKSPAKRTVPKKNAAKLTRKALVAVKTRGSSAAQMQVTFIKIGQLTASLFRNGVLINMQSISTSTSIDFADVQSGDVISVNGVCTGETDIVIVNVQTSPATPDKFTAGFILASYLVL